MRELDKTLFDHSDGQPSLDEYGVYVPGIGKKRERITVTEVLKNLDIPNKEIIKGGIRRINSEGRGYHNIGDKVASDIYVAVFLQEEGTPEDYKTYKNFMEKIDCSTDLYQISLAGLGKLLVDKKDLGSFFNLLEYSIDYKTKQSLYDGEEHKEELDRIDTIIKSIPDKMMDATIDFIGSSNDDFIKFIKRKYLKKSMQG